jgi:hypothetical protein
MAAVVSYPGVYIDEISSLSISVNSTATAVPIIPLNLFPDLRCARKFNSYLEFINFSGGFKDDPNGWCVRAYFECGGGPCYLVDADSLLSEIPKYDDITLFVTGGSDWSFSIEQICRSGSGIFVIADGQMTEIVDNNAIINYPANPSVALYYPWLTVPWAQGFIPPSAVMAGIYCSVDRTRGVWKAPANVCLPSGYQPFYKVTDDLQGLYNVGKAINMIRTIDQRGAGIFSARTLEDSDAWRYISVRRLFDSVERDIKVSMETLMFESNNPFLWEKVRNSINGYLYGLWRQGALVGATENEAYFVQIDEGVTMSASDIDQGKMIVRVGLAAVRPAEFIVLAFTQDMASA